MATTTGSRSGVSLHGALDEVDVPRHGLLSAISFKLGDAVIQDIRKASDISSGVQFVTGGFPKLHIGGRSIDLRLSPEAFRNELYSSTPAGSPSDLQLVGLVSHHGELKAAKNQPDGAGSDTALAALQNSLATYEQEKQANSTHLARSILPAYRNRFDAARKQKQDRRLINSSQSASPSLGGTSHLGAPLTSPPTSDAASLKQLMRTPLIHLLALKSISTDDISAKTHIPKQDLETLLLKIGTKEQGGKWKLSDRAYRDLDVWSFGYSSQSDRQTAIDNAIRAYDRLRIGKEEKIWQLLLPKAERNTGKTLSRLHLGVSKGLTPTYPSSPADFDGEVKPGSPANTPRIGAAVRPNSSKSKDVMKRLLSKDGGKRARAMEADKERKRKEKDERQAAAGASDREDRTSKRAATNKKPVVKYKSAETVHSSSDDDSGVDREAKHPISRVDSKMGNENSRPVAKPKAKPGSAQTAGVTKPKTLAEKSTAKAKAAAAVKSAASPALKAGDGTGKITPRLTNGNGLSAPNSQQKAQYSPQKSSSSKPPVPSPLGAARPRVASDVSNQGAVGVQRTRQEGGTPKGLGITNGVRKRQSTLTSSDSNPSSESDKKQDRDMAKTRKPTTNGVHVKPSVTNGTAPPPEHGLKRKSPPSGPSPAPKHRKTETEALRAQKPNLGIIQNESSSPTLSDIVLERNGGSSSDSAVSVLETISYSQGVHLAEKFRAFYPKYEQMYEAVQKKQERGDRIGGEEKEKLLGMHNRLQEMKRQIERAAQREHDS